MKTFTITQNQNVKLFFVMAFVFFFSSFLTAQEIQVKGIVKGKSEEAIEILVGANVYLKDTNIATSTNRKGEFTFPQKVKVGDVLVISYLGYLKKQSTIKEKSTFLDITLQEDDNEMLGALQTNKRYKSKRNKQ